MDVTTALSLLPPSELHDKINEIRSKHDKAYPRWPPHLNLFFPFLPVEKFEEVVLRLQTTLKGLEPLPFRLDEIGHFKQGRGATVHAKPDEETLRRLRIFFQLLRSILPEVEVKRDEYNAHLTLAQFPKKELEDQVALLRDWLSAGFEWSADRVYLMTRSREDGTVPFRVVYEVLFDGTVIEHKG